MERVRLVYVLCTLLMIFWMETGFSQKMRVKVKEHSRKCEHPYKVGTFKANWYKAEESCREANMRLVTIKGEQAAKRILETLERATDNVKTAIVGQFWTSGNDLAELGNFFWMSTGEEISKYTNWRKGTPSREERSYKNWQISPHCIYLEQYKNRYLWDYGPCTQKRYFICERPDVE